MLGRSSCDFFLNSDCSWKGATAIMGAYNFSHATFFKMNFIESKSFNQYSSRQPVTIKDPHFTKKSGYITSRSRKYFLCRFLCNKHGSTWFMDRT